MTLATRLGVGVLLACLLLGLGAPSVAAVDGGTDTPGADPTAQFESADGATTAGSSSATTEPSSARELLTLDFSVKRLVVSLGFVGALFARRHEETA